MSRRLRSRAGRPAGDRGFALVELLVAMAVMGLISAVAFGGLNTMTRASKGAQDRSHAVADARTALERIVRDLRAANPIDAVEPVSAYDTAVSFSVYCSAAGTGACGSTNLRPVSYRLVANRFERSVGAETTVLVGPGGPDNGPDDVRLGAVVNGADQPVFTYRDAAGQRLETQGATAVASTTLRDCARTIEVHLVVVTSATRPGATVDLTSRVDLRNHYEVSGC